MKNDLTHDKRIYSPPPTSLEQFSRLINGTDAISIRADVTASAADIRNLKRSRNSIDEEKEKKEKKEKRQKILLGKQTSGVPSPYAAWSAAPDAAAAIEAESQGAADSPAVEEASPVDPLSLPTNQSTKIAHQTINKMKYAID